MRHNQNSTFIFVHKDYFLFSLKSHAHDSVDDMLMPKELWAPLHILGLMRSNTITVNVLQHFSLLKTFSKLWLLSFYWFIDFFLWCPNSKLPKGNALSFYHFQKLCFVLKHYDEVLFGHLYKQLESTWYYN